MDYWHDIETGTTEKTNVVIEIPKGSQNKYEIDKKSGAIKLDRVLFSSISYPGDYGLIPRTLADDGDPLDGLVLVTNPTYPGIIIPSRPVGLLKMIDQGENDDKILCVPVDDIRFSHVKDITDIQKPVLNEIAHFFEIYKQLEAKKVKIDGWKNAKAAKEMIQKCINNYNKKFK